MNKAILNQLRDIHLPTPISWWPLAPGWYLLIAIMLLVIVVPVTLTIYHRRKYFYRNKALQHLQQIKIAYQNHANTNTTLQALSILLRQTALAYFPRRRVASLHGVQWLKFLDQTGNTSAFSHGKGKILATAPYQAHSHLDCEPLFKLTEQWIKTSYDSKENDKNSTKKRHLSSHNSEVRS